VSKPPYDIDYLFDEVITLPSLPATVSRVVEMVNDPKCSLADVGRAISGDPPLAAKTLRLVNTAFYGLREKVSSIEHAVVLLGLKVIKNLVFTATVFDTVKDATGLYFRHSVACGLAMRALSEHVSTPLADDAFALGLLHDIGKIVLETFLPKEYPAVISAIQTRRLSAYQAEREVLGLDHAQVGARLAEKWKLSESFVQAIGGHHDLTVCQDEANRPAAALITVADYVCVRSGLAPAHTFVQIDEPVWQSCGIGSAAMPKALEKFFNDRPVLDELMQLAAA